MMRFHITARTLPVHTFIYRILYVCVPGEYWMWSAHTNLIHFYSRRVVLCAVCLMFVVRRMWICVCIDADRRNPSLIHRNRRLCAATLMKASVWTFELWHTAQHRPSPPKTHSERMCVIFKCSILDSKKSKAVHKMHKTERLGRISIEGFAIFAVSIIFC